MATEVTLPRLGQGMESGTIVRWLKSEGDAVDRDEPLYELDTEKVTQEVEAGVSGVLLKILASEGSEIEVGKPICVIGEAGEEIPSDADASTESDPAPEAGDGAAPPGLEMARPSRRRRTRRWPPAPRRPLRLRSRRTNGRKAARPPQPRRRPSLLRRLRRRQATERD